VRLEDYRATLILMAGLAAAMGTGFLREAALAYTLGAGRATDIYLIAFTIPELVFISLPIILTPAFIPLFTDLRLHVGESGAWRFGLRVARSLLLLLLALTAFLAVIAPVYLRYLAPGFSPFESDLALRAMYLMLPAITIMGGAALAGATLQVYRRFARPALATAAYNLTFVLALLALPLAWPVNRAAWGVTLGAAAAFLIQGSLLWHYRPGSLAKGREDETEKRTFGVEHMVRLAGPLAAGYAVHHIILLVDRAMATTLEPGSVATLNYAYRLALIVGQLSGLAVSTALFPYMAEQAAKRDLAGLRSNLAGALRFVWMVGVPASGALVVMRTPLVEALFERGAFDHAATAAVSDLLPWYALAVLADALCQPLWRVIYAQRRAWTVLGVNGLQTGIRILCNVAFIGSLGYNGLALSAAVGLVVQLLVLGRLVRGDVGAYLTKEWWQDAAKTLVATAAALVVAGLLASQLSAAPAIVVLLASASLGTLCYLVAMRLMEMRVL
jgi:putative peptidoglycan lipid II flippase